MLNRATAALRPPAGSTLTLQDGTLAATGAPPLSWVGDAVRLAPLVPGITHFDATTTLEPTIRNAIAAIEGRSLRFVLGSVQLADAGEPLAMLAADVQQLDALGALAGLSFDLTIVGHTDAEGADATNVPLSIARAELVAEALRADTLRQVRVVTRGVGSADPIDTAQTELSNRVNRRVSLSVARAASAR
ncbi:MAG: OmpA family protein [Acidobacteriota bacterium]